MYEAQAFFCSANCVYVQQCTCMSHHLLPSPSLPPHPWSYFIIILNFSQSYPADPSHFIIYSLIPLIWFTTPTLSPLLLSSTHPPHLSFLFILIPFSFLVWSSSQTTIHIILSLLMSTSSPTYSLYHYLFFIAILLSPSFTPFLSTHSQHSNFLFSSQPHFKPPFLFTPHSKHFSAPLILIIPSFSLHSHLSQPFILSSPDTLILLILLIFLKSHPGLFILFIFINIIILSHLTKAVNSHCCGVAPALTSRFNHLLITITPFYF